MRLRCPVCDHNGEIKGTDEFFETRGQWQGAPVRRCRGCGSGLIVRGLLRPKAEVIPDDLWERMQASFDRAASLKRGYAEDRFDPRDAALEPAADRLDAEIEASPVDDYFALILTSTAWGGYRALQLFCNTIESEGAADEPAADFLWAVEQPAAAEAAVRAAAWILTIWTLGQHWPDRWQAAAGTAAAAMPVADESKPLLRELGSLAVQCNSEQGDGSDLLRFNRLALEWLIGRATGQKPEKGQLLVSTMVWSECFISGSEAGRERLEELEQQNPEMVP